MTIPKPLSVSKLVSQIKSKLEMDFKNIYVAGEVSNFSRAVSGHYYFSLKDRDSLIQINLFKGDAFRNPIIKDIKEGDEIEIFGNISVFEKRGTFQVIARKILIKGKGTLLEKFEQLKRKLSKEGLFDVSAKKIIPSFPKRIAVITAPQGAAIQDFLNVYRRRALWTNILISPCLVQGQAAPISIMKALEKVRDYHERKEKIDLVVLTRGGGSLEDLWAFNDEQLNRFLFNFPIPTVSAIGHQVDYCLTDFVCDLRAETPTAAAEIISESQVVAKEKLETLKKNLKSIIKLKMTNINLILNKQNPKSLLGKVIYLVSRMKEHMKRIDLINRQDRLLNIEQLNMRADDSIEMIHQKVVSLLDRKTNKLETCSKLISALNPHEVLSRGYSYCTNERGDVVKSISEFDSLDKKSVLNINFYGGKGEVQKI